MTYPIYKNIEIDAYDLAKTDDKSSPCDLLEIMNPEYVLHALFKQRRCASLNSELVEKNITSMFMFELHDVIEDEPLLIYRPIDSKSWCWKIRGTNIKITESACRWLDGLVTDLNDVTEDHFKKLYGGIFFGTKRNVDPTGQNYTLDRGDLIIINRSGSYLPFTTSFNFSTDNTLSLRSNVDLDDVLSRMLGAVGAVDNGDGTAVISKYPGVVCRAEGAGFLIYPTDEGKSWAYARLDTDPIVMDGQLKDHLDWLVDNLPKNLVPSEDYVWLTNLKVLKLMSLIALRNKSEDYGDKSTKVIWLPGNDRNE